MTGVIHLLQEESTPDTLQCVAATVQPYVRQILLVTDHTAELCGFTDAAAVLRAAQPLEALREALLWARDDVLFIPGTLTAPSDELFAYLLHVRAGHEAVIPEIAEGETCPDCAIYSQGCLRRVVAVLGEGRFTLEALVPHLQAHIVTAPEVAKFGDPRYLLSRV